MSRDPWITALQNELVEARASGDPKWLGEVRVALQRVRAYRRRFPSANGYVVVPRHLLDELVEAWTNDGNITRCDNAAQALVAAVVEAVGPTT